MAFELKKISESIKNTIKNITSTHTHTWIHKDRVFSRIAPKKYALRDRDICSDRECGEIKVVVDKEEI